MPEKICREMLLREKGSKIRFTLYIDTDFAFYLATRKSLAAVVAFAIRTNIKSVSKRRATVDTSMHGSELVAARIVVELAIELRYEFPS